MDVEAHSTAPPPLLDAQPLPATNPRDRSQLRDLTFLSWVICSFFLIPALLITLQAKGRNTDFLYLYSLGRIANRHPAPEIYDARLQQETFREVQPLAPNSRLTYGPSPYPPFIPILFRPLAHVSFARAQSVWGGITLALFLSGLGLLVTRFYPDDRLLQSLIFAAALAFRPFLANTLVNGQIAALGFFAFSLALCEQDRGRYFNSGLALSICAYKPTLLFLIAPMLLVRKQGRILSGLVVGTALLTAATTFLMGTEVWPAYFHFLVSLGRWHAVLDFPMYVDAVAFWTLLLQSQHWLIDTLMAISFIAGGSLLVRTWVRAGNANATTDVRLVWAATMSSMLFLNVYVPYYDTILIIPSILISAGPLLASYRRTFIVLLVVLFVLSWIAEPVARRTGLQLLTVGLVTVACLQLRVFLRSSRNLSNAS